MEVKTNKNKIYGACLSSIETRYHQLIEQMNDLQSSANEETKSSAGDKYETGRAMVMLEKEKLAEQIAVCKKQQQVLSTIDPSQKHSEIRPGSLVTTDQGVYFISIGIGNLKGVDQVFCISPAAPLAQLMNGKKAGDYFMLRKREVKITKVE